jgi:hypothetical protein
MSHECGAKTLSGGNCKRKVTGELAHCPMHCTSNETCSICLSNLDGACKTLPCNHRFHRKCIIGWKKIGNHTCPMCRAPFTNPIPEYKITIIVENIRNQTFTHTSNTIPELVDRLNIITPDSVMTEIVIDVDSRSSLTEVLRDLGIQTLPSPF